MLKLPIEYTDFNGVAVQETHYFNLSTAEVAEMELTMAGGLTENLTRIGESGNAPLIMKTFKEILLSSVGVRSEDGRLFRKSPEITADFVASGAYDVLYTRIVTDAEYAAMFIRGIMPSNEDPNAQHLIKAAQDRKVAQGAEDRPIPQAVQQKVETATNYWGQYLYAHNNLLGQGIEHVFVEEQFFNNMTPSTQEAMIKDLQSKLPQGNG